MGRSTVPSHVGGHTKIKESKAPLFGSSLQKSCAASLCPRCFFLSKALSYSLLTSTQVFLACHTIHARCLGALVLWLEDNSSMFLMTTAPCMRHIPVQLRSDCLQNCGHFVDDILRLTGRPRSPAYFTTNRGGTYTCFDKLRYPHILLRTFLSPLSEEEY